MAEAADGVEGLVLGVGAVLGEGVHVDGAAGRGGGDKLRVRADGERADVAVGDAAVQRVHALHVRAADREDRKLVPAHVARHEHEPAPVPRERRHRVLVRAEQRHRLPRPHVVDPHRPVPRDISTPSTTQST